MTDTPAASNSTVERVIAMVRKLRAEGLPIHGVTINGRMFTVLTSKVSDDSECDDVDAELDRLEEGMNNGH